MQFLKRLLVLVIFLISFVADADEDRAYTQVNFYTLASMQSQLHSKKIEIRGWIEFYEFESSKKVLLFPSEESKRIFNVRESIEISIDDKNFEAAKKYLSDNFVAVYGLYHFLPIEGQVLYGKIREIDDIDIVTIN